MAGYTCRQNRPDSIVQHNQRLVRTAHSLQANLSEVVAVMRAVVDRAAPISQIHEVEPSEYVISIEDVNNLRRMVAIAELWGHVDSAGGGDDSAD